MATERTVFDYQLTVASRGNMVMTFTGRNSYANTSGSKPWQMAVYLDGTLVNSAGGAGAYTDSPSLQAVALNVPAGTHRVLATWYGHSSMTFTGAVLTISEAYK